MKIAIGTHDKKTINPDHFGESKYFCVAEILMAKPYSADCRENPYPGHGIPGKGRKIADLLHDCDAYVVRSIGKDAFKLLPERGIQIFLTRLTDLDEIIRTFSEGDLSAYKKFNPQTQKFEVCE